MANATFNTSFPDSTMPRNGFAAACHATAINRGFCPGGARPWSR